METQRIVLEKVEPTTEAYLIPHGRPGAPSIRITEYASVGRDSDCHLVVNDSFVSSRHARIERRAQGVIVRDLHSRNGTYLNGSRITEAVLTAGDRLQFGETVFIFSETPADTLDLSSKNPQWSEELRRLPAFAATDFAVLLAGPSGSGKEILARAIHRHSTRAASPFVTINCSALSESLIESELFGHVRGSFTGATHDRKGAFESARGGTLFLDEIGDLPLSLQPKLLRAIENNEIRPVGSDRAIETDVRIISATHKNLVQQVRQGKFREDLFYRLNVCQMRPPTLRERMEDFETFVYQFAKQYRVRFSFNAIERLKEHSWPGNVRELKNLVARASAYYPGKHLQSEDVSAILGPIVSDRSMIDDSISREMMVDSENLGASVGTKGSLIREFEKEMIMRRLIANRGNQRRTAKDLGMPKSTLHDRIKIYSIDLEQLETQFPPSGTVSSLDTLTV